MIGVYGSLFEIEKHYKTFISSSIQRHAASLSLLHAVANSTPFMKKHHLETADAVGNYNMAYG